MPSHRKIAAVVERPAHCLFAGKTVDDSDLARLRHVYEDATVRAGKLKTFGVSLQWNVGDLAVRRGIDHRECAAPVTNEHSVGRAIHRFCPLLRTPRLVTAAPTRHPHWSQTA